MNVTYRKKDGNIQAIISYKQQNKWKQKSKQGFKTKREAKEWVDKVSFSLLEDKLNDIEYSDLTIKQGIELYVNYKKNLVKQSTLQSILTQLKVLKEIEDIKISDIRPYQINTFFQQKQKETNSTYKAAQSQARTFLNFCIKELQIIKNNPLTIQKKERKDNRKKYIDKKLYNNILTTIKYKDINLFIKILYNTGLRLSEALGLRQRDIKDCVIILKEQRYEDKQTSLKTKNSQRKIPIPICLYNEIKSLEVKSKDEYIFTFHKGTLYYILSQFGVSAHCFRHTYASNMLNKGINIKIVADLLGDTLDTVIKTYIQTPTEELDKVFKNVINSTTL
ncbi:MAG: tyrosine-type recombinase/integrase [Peptoanaerobacter stomatis]|uniref:tyrosine-type recombinase/integrase n=1 Tax=Peptoanaerobacter stomatis TaxID=796937 RepID=UPI003FA12B6F